MSEYSVMSLVELKQAAKGRGIKMYYVMKRAELIRVLDLPELPLSMRVQKMTIKQLRAEAKRRGLTGFWDLHRANLVALLYPEFDGRDETPADEDQKNQGNTHEHNDPKEHDSK
jgi:hypothetical protein